MADVIDAAEQEYLAGFAGGDRGETFLYAFDDVAVYAAVLDVGHAEKLMPLTAVCKTVAEKDDIGRYNADDMLIENCSFYRLLGLPINIYRGGSDESTAGPYVTIRHCTFVDCCNKERGSVMRLIGPQVLTVENCNFDNSGRGGATIRLDEATWEKVRIANCNLWNSGRMVTTTAQAIQGKMYNIRPAYTNAEAYDYVPVRGSELEKLSIGLRKN